MFSNRKSDDGMELYFCSRKRKHESEQELMNPKSERHQGLIEAVEALDLINLIHELALFDYRTERINVKDMISQEFIDRIGKLYKPVLLNSTANQVSIIDNERLNRKKPLFVDDIISHFQEEIIKHCSEKLLLPFSNFEDIVMGLAVMYFGEAFTHNESLNRILCEHMNTMSKNTFGNNYENYSDICLGNFDTQKRKRRKIMSLCLSPLFKQ